MHISVDTHSHKENVVRHRFNRLGEQRALCLSLSPHSLSRAREIEVLNSGHMSF